MKLLGYAFLFVVAAGFITVIAIGAAFKLIGLIFMALLVVGGVTFVIRKLRKRDPMTIDHPIEAERLPR